MERKTGQAGGRTCPSHKDKWPRSHSDSHIPTSQNPAPQPAGGTCLPEGLIPWPVLSLFPDAQVCSSSPVPSPTLFYCSHRSWERRGLQIPGRGRAQWMERAQKALGGWHGGGSRELGLKGHLSRREEMWFPSPSPPFPSHPVLPRCPTTRFPRLRSLPPWSGSGSWRLPRLCWL
jgi:hypothetical protein